MIITLNIIKGTEMQFLDRGKDAVEKFLNTSKSRRETFKFYISKMTSEYLDEIIEIIGSEYKENITIVPDKELKFGVIKISLVDIFASLVTPPIKSTEITLMDYVTAVSIDRLAETITLENPTYLVMSKGTWVTLCNADEDNTDSYALNNKAYYHSYKKVVVALSEFLEMGRVDIIV